MSLPDFLLDLPAEETARLIALALVDELLAARGRLDDPSDAEALHDFRVALRRLRTALDAYRPQLGNSATKRIRRELRAIARASRESRDLEVHLAWVRSAQAGLSPRQHVGAVWLAKRIAARKQKADATLRAEVERRFSRTTGRLVERLRVYRARIELDPERRRHAAAAVIGSRIQRLGGDLECTLARVHSLRDDVEAHAARIAAKRLRYLLEPIEDQVEEVGPLLERLRHLQDELGDLHDSHVFVGELADAVDQAGVEQAHRLSRAVRAWQPEGTMQGVDGDDPRPGLLALARRLRERGETAFGRVRAEWLDGKAEEFFRQVIELGKRLPGRKAVESEIERKYLLRELPPTAREAPSVEIEQGYLPGTRLVERVRQIRSEGEEAWYRTVKSGSGVRRLELEEATTRDLFESVWPLTEGRRVLKRRRRLKDGDLTWEIDEFIDRDLVLAEVELPSKDSVVEPPAWLRPYVIREVTESPEYTNAALAH